MDVRHAGAHGRAPNVDLPFLAVTVRVLDRLPVDDEAAPLSKFIEAFDKMLRYFAEKR
jgi:hypothetical protein